MPLVNCEMNLILTWSTDFVISSATRATKVAITNTKLSKVPVVTLLTQDNAKLLQQLEVLKEQLTIKNVNRKYQSKVLTKRKNQYLDFLIDQTSRSN